METPYKHGKDARQIAQKIPSQEIFFELAEIFKLLGDTNRLRIFWLLCHCEECVINISYMMDMSSPAVSHHLKQLKAGGLITNRREGKEVYYRAVDCEQANLLHKAVEKMLEINCLDNDI